MRCDKHNVTITIIMAPKNKFATTSQIIICGFPNWAVNSRASEAWVSRTLKSFRKNYKCLNYCLWLNNYDWLYLEQIIQFFNILIHHSKNIRNFNNWIIFFINQMQIKICFCFINRSILILMNFEIVNINNCICNVAEYSAITIYFKKISIKK